MMAPSAISPASSRFSGLLLAMRIGMSGRTSNRRRALVSLNSRPSKVTASPLNSARIMVTVSRRASFTCFRSRCISVKPDPPAPSASRARPPDSSSRLATAAASIAGIRQNGSDTHGPSLIVVVFSASAASVTKTSFSPENRWSAWTKCSKPRSSASFATETTFFSGSTGAIPTPNLTISSSSRSVHLREADAHLAHTFPAHPRGLMGKRIDPLSDSSDQVRGQRTVDAPYRAVPLVDESDDEKVADMPRPLGRHEDGRFVVYEQVADGLVDGLILFRDAIKGIEHNVDLAAVLHAVNRLLLDRKHLLQPGRGLWRVLLVEFRECLDVPQRDFHSRHLSSLFTTSFCRPWWRISSHLCAKSFGMSMNVANNVETCKFDSRPLRAGSSAALPPAAGSP